MAVGWLPVTVGRLKRWLVKGCGGGTLVAVSSKPCSIWSFGCKRKVAVGRLPADAW